MEYADLYFAYVLKLCHMWSAVTTVKTNYLKCEFFIMYTAAILTKAHALCMYHVEEAVSWCMYTSAIGIAYIAALVHSFFFLSLHRSHLETVLHKMS